MPRINPHTIGGHHDLFYSANESYNRTVETGGKAYMKACIRERQRMFVTVLYWIAGAYALMWAGIIWWG